MSNLQGLVRATTAVIAAGALAGSLVFSLLWLLRPTSYWFVLVTSYTPYALPGYLVALIALLALLRGLAAPLRRWVQGAAVLAAAGVVLHAALLAPAYVGEHPGGPADLTVTTLNAKRGGVDASDVLRLARAERTQVLVLTEITPELLVDLQDAGLEDALPYAAGEPGAKSSGTMIFSAYRLTDVAELPLDHVSYQVEVEAPEPFTLVAVHVAQPLNDNGNSWRADWSVITQVLDDLDAPVVVAGDFNTTLEHRPLRGLLDDGFADAARASNAGWQPTYPRPLGLIAIDHVLVRGTYAAVGTTTGSVDGTDHRALTARLAVR